MPLFESKQDAALRRKIAAEEKEKFDKAELIRKEKLMRAQEKAKLESGGFIGSLVKQGEKALKDVLK